MSLSLRPLWRRTNSRVRKGLPSDIHDIFDDLLAKVYAQASSFGRLLQKRTLQVTYLDLDGNECDQYDVEPSDGAADPGA